MKCRWCRKAILEENGAWNDDGPMLRSVCVMAPGFRTRHEPVRDVALAEFVLAVAVVAAFIALLYEGVIK